MPDTFNIFVEVHRLGATNSNSDLAVQLGIEYHLKQATNENIMDIIKVCNIIEVVGVNCESYRQACRTLNLKPF